MTKILLAEDDHRLNKIVATALQEAGYEVETVFSALEASERLHATRYDLAIFAWCFGGESLSGINLIRQVCRTQRELPVIILSSRKALVSRVTGITCGADDFILKPFHLPNLLARVQTLLAERQTSRGSGCAGNKCTIMAGGLTLNPQTGKTTFDGKPLALDLKEFALLKLLLQNLGEVVPRSEITARVWPGETTPETSNTIEVHIKTLRKKIGRLGHGIRTVRGQGYRFSPC